MTDIFVSYAREDRDVAERLAQVLRHEGWSVWWDRKIPVGQSFSRVIEQALEVARCVIVIWSPAAIASEWVSAEAAEGLRRHVLVPVRLGEVRPPLEFRRLHTATLTRDLSDQAELQECLSAVRAVLRESGTGVLPDPATGDLPPRSQPLPRTPTGRARRILIRSLVLMVFIGVAAALVWSSFSPSGGKRRITESRSVNKGGHSTLAAISGAAATNSLSSAGDSSGNQNQHEAGTTGTSTSDITPQGSKVAPPRMAAATPPASPNRENSTFSQAKKTASELKSYPSEEKKEAAQTKRDLNGRWQGNVNDRNILWPYPIELVIDTSAAFSGTIEYPSRNCAGYLVLTERSAGELVFKEILTRGDCADSGTIRLRLTSDKRSALWTWLDRDGSIMSSAVLTPR